jgi:Ca-activated chloride channel family protein
VDIALSIDISGSMQAVDFRPQNRMEAAKQVALNFINRRTDDRFAIVTFATYAHTLVPLTNDFNTLNTIVSNIKADPEGQTAIGNGIAIAAARVKDSPAESRMELFRRGISNRWGNSFFAHFHLSQLME